jgi:hypothetical protein
VPEAEEARSRVQADLRATSVPKKRTASPKPARRGAPPTSTKLPHELEGALQALAYWIGYQHERYRHHPLSEGAIVDEFARLLSEKLGRDRGLVVCREHSIGAVSGNRGDDAKRFDVVVGSPSGNKANLVAEPAYCIEVKRASKAYESDLERLRIAASESQGRWRGFAIVVGHARPEFLNDKHKARRGTFPSSNGVSFAVRRVVRAHGAVQAKPKSGHWVCVLETVPRRA